MPPSSAPAVAPASPPPLDPALVRELEAVVGADAVLVDPDRLLVYESDGLTQYRVPPRAVVLPGERSQVARVFRILHQAGLPVVPRGAGTGLSGGALATGGGILVGTARLNRILEVDPMEFRARVEPGVVNAMLTRATLPYGLIYAPDPSSQSACTLGGNVAENSGGPHCLKHGVTSRYVRSLVVALPSGEEVRLGGEEAAGELDLAGLFTGSEGCFGMAVEIEVGLIPAPRAVRTLLALFPSMERAGEAVTGIMGQGLLPAALEIVDRETIRAVEASVFAAGFPLDAGAALVVEFDGIEAGLDREAALAREACARAGATEIREAASAQEREALWRGRKKAFGAMGRIAPDLLVQDATVPRSRLPQVLARIAEIGDRHRLRVANVFHAGDGNLHPNLLFDRRDAEELARVEAASKEIMEVCIEAGGTITGEHGVGIDKRKYLPLVCPPPVLRAMGEVRRAFDPLGRSNPGKVLPDGWGPPHPPRPPMVHGQDEEEGGAVAGVPGGVRGNSEALGNRGGWEPGAGILEHEPADLLLRARGGTLVAQAGEVVARAGQWLPFDPPGDPGTLTLEALVLGGEDGPLALGYGRVRDHLLGVVLRTPAGERLELGGRVVKNVAGFDLVRLVAGSRGRVGRLEEVTLRLFGIPEVDRTLLLAPGEGGGLPMARELMATGLPLGALELVAGTFAAETLTGGGGVVGSGELGEAQGRATQGAGLAPPFLLALRILGNRAQVEAMTLEVEGVVRDGLVEGAWGSPVGAAAAAGGAGLRTLDGEEGRAWWGALSRALGGERLQVAGPWACQARGWDLLSRAPSTTGGVRPRAVVFGPGGTGLRASFLPGGLDEPRGEALRGRLEGLGARLLRDGEGVDPRDPVRARLHREVIRVFDPAHGGAP